MFDEKYKYYKLSSREKKAVIKRIRETLEAENIPLALLFGSFIELSSFRDIDIAVYLKGPNLDHLLKLASRLEETIGYPVDLIPLNTASSTLKHYILTKGLVILEKHAGLYEALLSQTLDELRALKQPTIPKD